MNERLKIAFIHEDAQMNVLSARALRHYNLSKDQIEEISELETALSLGSASLYGWSPITHAVVPGLSFFTVSNALNYSPKIISSLRQSLHRITVIQVGDDYDMQPVPGIYPTYSPDHWINDYTDLSKELPKILRLRK